MTTFYQKSALHSSIGVLPPSRGGRAALILPGKSSWKSYGHKTEDQLDDFFGRQV
jgi:hypothetical protein